MRLLVRKLFCGADVGKIEKNSYMSGMIMSMLAIVICLIAMCGSAYAFFTATLTSESNVIQAATFDLNIRASNQNDIQNSTITPGTEEGSYILSVQTLTINEGENVSETETFNFVLSKQGTATTGYAKVMFEIGEINQEGYQHSELYTQQIAANEEQTVSVLVPAGYSVKVTFVPQWGTRSGTEHMINGVVDISTMFAINPAVEVLEEEEKEEVVTESFDAGICVTDAATGLECTAIDGAYALHANGVYTVTLTAKEDNTAAKGYGIISVNGQEYYALFDNENGLAEISFTIYPVVDGNCSCSFVAGELPEDIAEEKLITNGDQIKEESETPEDAQDQQEEPGTQETTTTTEPPIQQEPPVQPESTENPVDSADSQSSTPEPRDPAEPNPQVEEPEITPTEEVTE